jgi:DNA-binding transcriptional MocR family regulator
VPRGGLHLWVRLPSRLDDVEVTERARARRLVVGAGRPYYVSEPPGSRLRLSFSAADDTQASAGVRLLAETVAETAD